ncbi:hypothetical protein [Sorangium cellulosum]|uniref:hypothetical protein n=1 Tax=Sorangium cellulosum TaxID=56 RepID=UPI0004091DB5|nr:hypothetical protein [Sorangium cellulosum]
MAPAAREAVARADREHGVLVTGGLDPQVVLELQDVRVVRAWNDWSDSSDMNTRPR